MKSVSSAMLSLLLFALIALIKADSATVSDSSTMIVPHINVKTRSTSISDESVHSYSVSFNYSPTVSAIVTLSTSTTTMLDLS